MDTNLTTMSRDAVTAATRHALAHGNPSVEPRCRVGAVCLGTGSQIGHGEYLARVVAVASAFPIGENERSSEGRSCSF